MSGNEGITALALIIAATCFAALCAVYSLVGPSDSPLRRWRKLRTPSCRLCEHCTDADACTCPIAREMAERLEGRRVEWLRCLEVRGTRACVFEPKKEEKE